MLAQNLLETFLFLQNTETESKTALNTWILENLLAFCRILIDRMDIWYLSKEKVQVKKHTQYKKLKKFAVNYYQDLFKTFAAIFQSNTTKSENEKLYTLKLSVLSIFEGFGWTEGISTSVYYDLANEVPALNDYLKSQTPGAIRFFVLSPKRKIDEGMQDSAYAKLVRHFCETKANFLVDKKLLEYSVLFNN